MHRVSPVTNIYLSTLTTARYLHSYSLLSSYCYFMTLNSNNYGYVLSKETPINNVLFIDDLKLYGKIKRDLKSLVHAVRKLSKNIGI